MRKHMSRTHHHGKRHHVAAIRNPTKQADDAIHIRANTILEESPYYEANIRMLERRVQQGKVSVSLARRIRPAIVAQTFRDAKIPLSESRRLMHSIGLR